MDARSAEPRNTNSGTYALVRQGRSRDHLVTGDGGATPLIPWVDAHCHLPPEPVCDERVESAAAAGVAKLIDVGTTLDRSQQALASARRHPGRVFCTAGVHPHDASEGVGGIEEMLGHEEVVAVGECGLDYHYDHSPRPVQRDVFAAHISMANRHRLPLVVHTRQAWDDTFTILDREGMPERTVFHCFSGGPGEAGEALARGAFLSISGIVTFANADDLRAAVGSTAPDRLLVETDSPYLAPEPLRGRENEPANVVYVGAKVAELHEMTVEDFAKLAWSTTHSVYGLPR